MRQDPARLLPLAEAVARRFPGVVSEVGPSDDGTSLVIRLFPEAAAGDGGEGVVREVSAFVAANPAGAVPVRLLGTSRPTLIPPAIPDAPPGWAGPTDT